MKKIIGLFVLLLPLTACSIDSPTWVSTERVEVHQDIFTDTFDTDSLDDATLHAIGVHYYNHGNGPMKVAVSYDPKSKTNTLSKAQKNAARFEDAMHKNGVADVRVTTTPAATGDKSNTIVSFEAVVAKAPTGCSMMPGYANTPTMLPDSANTPIDYKMGCSVESLMAQQIARPSDLLGKPGFETHADGRRQATVVNDRGYYDKKSNAKLEGESATGDK